MFSEVSEYFKRSSKISENHSRNLSKSLENFFNSLKSLEIF